ncbi:MAG TPA: PIG-L family deacetylase, partial [Erysipelotrichaceae bacterium]|nr:PIG-L family deacetylase [Erysipelotrichaceae bacterium]
KENLMSEVYLSQGYAHRIFNHMVPYEKFIRYKDWYFGF